MELSGRVWSDAHVYNVGDESLSMLKRSKLSLAWEGSAVLVHSFTSKKAQTPVKSLKTG